MFFEVDITEYFYHFITIQRKLITTSKQCKVIQILKDFISHYSYISLSSVENITNLCIGLVITNIGNNWFKTHKPINHYQVWCPN